MSQSKKIHMLLITSVILVACGGTESTTSPEGKTGNSPASSGAAGGSLGLS